MTDSYVTLGEPATHKITRKRSRFITLLCPVSSEQEANAHVSDARRAFHDATHCCHAARWLTDDGLRELADDAGEPSGSAGLPMLQQLAQRELCNVSAVVVRYFGGVKLGVGGLVRAYADAVSEALEEAVIVTRQVRARIALRFPTEAYAAVMSLLHRSNVDIMDVSFDAAVRMTIAIPPSRVDGLRDAYVEATGARGQLEVLS